MVWFAWKRPRAARMRSATGVCPLPTLRVDSIDSGLSQVEFPWEAPSSRGRFGTLQPATAGGTFT